MSRAGTPEEKYWEFRKSLIRFETLMCDEHITLLIGLNAGPIRTKTNLEFWATSVKAVVNIAMPPTNGTQLWNPLKSFVTKPSP